MSWLKFSVAVVLTSAATWSSKAPRPSSVMHDCCGASPIST